MLVGADESRGTYLTLNLNSAQYLGLDSYILEIKTVLIHGRKQRTGTNNIKSFPYLHHRVQAKTPASANASSQSE
jgi:hypothetical protein